MVTDLKLNKQEGKIPAAVMLEASASVAAAVTLESGWLKGVISSTVVGKEGSKDRARVS